MMDSARRKPGMIESNARASSLQKTHNTRVSHTFCKESSAAEIILRITYSRYLSSVDRCEMISSGDARSWNPARFAVAVANAQ